MGVYLLKCGVLPGPLPNPKGSGSVVEMMFVVWGGRYCFSYGKDGPPSEREERGGMGNNVVGLDCRRVRDRVGLDRNLGYIFSL